MRRSSKNFTGLATELWQTIVAYAKQETVEPISRLRNFVLYGIAGSFMFGLGMVLLNLALLRALQTETSDTFSGHLTWIPYLLTLFVMIAFVLIAIWLIGKDKRASRKGARL